MQQTNPLPGHFEFLRNNSFHVIDRIVPGHLQAEMTTGGWSDCDCNYRRITTTTPILE